MVSSFTADSPVVLEQDNSNCHRGRADCRHAFNDKQQRFVNHIKQGSSHLLQLINDILDLSKNRSRTTPNSDARIFKLRMRYQRSSPQSCPAGYGKNIEVAT